MNRRTLLQLASASMASAALPVALGEVTKAESTSAPAIVTVTNATAAQEQVDAAPSHSVILFNPNLELVFAKTLRITKPLTLRGLNARLPQGLSRSPIVLVVAEGVAIEDFRLVGNTETVAQDVRSPLISIEAGDFRVERGLVIDASRHGVQIAPQRKTGDVVGGVVRDIVGHGNSRCVVGIGQRGEDGVIVRNVIVENIRCYKSRLRGAVNVKDGTDNIIVRDVYSEDSIYAVDVQDHQRPNQINSNITVENIYALRCRHAVRTNNGLKGHANLVVRNVTAEECAIPVRISNTDRVVLENIRVLNQKVDTLSDGPVLNMDSIKIANTRKEDRIAAGLPEKQQDTTFPPILIAGCSQVFIRDVVVQGSDYVGSALAIVDSDDVAVSQVTLERLEGSLKRGLDYLITEDREFAGLRVHGIHATDFGMYGIVLRKLSPQGTLSRYLISGNVASVVDEINGIKALITNNLF